MAYLVSYGLGPYLNQMTIREIVEGHIKFHTALSQCSNSSGEKQ